jgi:hypothetical protein
VTALDAADLVLIAARTLGIGSDAALAAMDLPAAQAALAAADSPGREQGPALSGRDDAAAAGVELVDALLRHRPFPRRNQQVAITAGLQFLSLNGWRADLNPPATAAVVVEALASGRLTPAAAATWLSPRLSPAPRVPRSGPRPRLLATVPGPARRAAVGVLCAGLVGGAAVLTAACSHAPGMAPAPTHAVHQLKQGASPAQR